MSNFLLNVNLEASSGRGEDSHLILAGNDNDKENCVIGVFDGLGGRSAGFDDLRGGQIASKEASQFSKKILSQWNSQLTEEIAHQIQSDICHHLKSQADAKMPKSRLSGTLTGKRLCTTIALAGIREREKGIYDINLAWMGDSRIYFLSASKGLQQLTIDDLEEKKDAFEMIREDPPMSQYLTADILSNWHIHYASETIEECGCILACTDGCFQYLATPWDFEKLLIETLMNATSPAEWETFMIERYNQIKQDDVSLILSPLGFTSFEHIRDSYISRHEDLISKYSNTATDIESLRQLWNIYRHNYESRLKVNVATVDEKDANKSQVEFVLSPDEYQTSKATNHHTSQNFKSKTADQPPIRDESEKTKVRSPELPPLCSPARASCETHSPDIANQIQALLEKAHKHRSRSRSINEKEPHHNKKALELYCKALELAPNDRKILFEIGSIYLEINNPLEAIKYLEKVSEVDNTEYSRVLTKHLAEAYHKTNQHEKATIWFAKLYPQLEELSMEMYAESLIEDIKLENAISVCESIRSINPNNPHAVYLIGHIRHKQCHLNEAEKFLNLACNLYTTAYNNTRSHTDSENLQIVKREYREVLQERNQS